MKLSGSFCNIQVILQKTVDCGSRLIVLGFGDLIPKNLLQKTFADGDGPGWSPARQHQVL